MSIEYEKLDFHYLLELLMPLKEVPEFAWLPELFSIVGIDRLLKLCKYAGGEEIRIPTLDELLESVEILQWFYDIEIKKSRSIKELPEEFHASYKKIVDIYNVRQS